MIDGEPDRENEGMQLFRKGDAILSDAIFVSKYYPVGDLGKARFIGIRGDVLEHLKVKKIGALYLPDNSSLKYGTVDSFIKMRSFFLTLDLKQPEAMRKGPLATSVKVTNPGYTGSIPFELNGKPDRSGDLDEFIITDSGKRKKIMLFVNKKPLILAQILESLRFRFSAMFTDSLEKEEL